MVRYTAYPSIILFRCPATCMISRYSFCCWLIVSLKFSSHHLRPRKLPFSSPPPQLCLVVVWPHGLLSHCSTFDKPCCARHFSLTHPRPSPPWQSTMTTSTRNVRTGLIASIGCIFILLDKTVSSFTPVWHPTTAVLVPLFNLPITSTFSNWHHFAFSLTFWRQNYFFFNFSTSCI